MNKSQLAIRKFRDAERSYGKLQDSWYKLSQANRDLVGAEKWGLVAARQAVESAASQLIEEAADRHRIEEVAKVYLVLGPSGWQLDSLTTIDAELVGQDQGPTNTDCEHEKGKDTECAALRDAVAYLGMPTGGDMAAMFRDLVDPTTADRSAE